MRRKDWKYYLKTIFLKWNAFQFQRLKERQHFISLIDQRRQEYQDKLSEVELQYEAFDPYFHSYFYFENTSIFDKSYHKENQVPIRLKNQTLNNPLLAFYFGLVESNHQLKEQKKNDIIFQHIDQMVDSFTDKHNDRPVFPYQQDYALFNLKAPWISGITQALACSYYCRRAFFSQNNQFISSAQKSFEILTVSVHQGGLLQSTAAGLEWVEEYPSHPPSYVLNGHIFAIIAAIELYQCSKQESYKIYANQWIKSLMHHLPEYQFKHYLLHNKYQNKLSNIEYQGLHVGLFHHLHVLTKHPLFLELYSYYNQHMDWKDFHRFYDLKN